MQVSKTPDGHETPGRFVDVHPISRVSLSQIVGLVEAIDEAGGVADAAAIAQDVDMQLDGIGPVVAAAEFLGTIKVDEGDLELTDLGRRILSADIRERKSIFREIVENVPVFRRVMEGIRTSGRSLSREEVLETLSSAVGTHHAEDVFRALVYWGRYVELVAYDSGSEQLSLRSPAA